MSAKTRDEWRLLGYFVIPFEMPVGEDEDGKAVYEFSQVVESEIYDLRMDDDEREMLGIPRRV